LTQASEHGVARGARFRHVVFKEAGRRRAVNLAPRPPGHPFPTPLIYNVPPQLDADEQRFLDRLFARSGLDARAYRPETLRRRLPACLRALRAKSLADARLALEGDPAAAVPAALNTMVIGVTSFFRDAGVFNCLASTVLPALPRSAGHPRVWSAGCSDGEEVYSVAMLLAELNLLAGSHLLATDCRPQAIAAARAGRYAPRALRDVPPSWREKYFQVDDDPAAAAAAAARVRPELRAAVQWRTGDVTRLCEPGAWDLILCRNLTMYLRPDVASRVWAALEAALRPGGFVVVGKAERPIGAQRLGVVAPCIYRKDRA
jgi:chemotaxis methyl-accepting protein methylase